MAGDRLTIAPSIRPTQASLFDAEALSARNVVAIRPPIKIDPVSQEIIQRASGQLKNGTDPGVEWLLSLSRANLLAIIHPKRKRMVGYMMDLEKLPQSNRPHTLKEYGLRLTSYSSVKSGQIAYSVEHSIREIVLLVQDIEQWIQKTTPGLRFTYHLTVGEQPLYVLLQVISELNQAAQLSPANAFKFKKSYEDFYISEVEFVNRLRARLPRKTSDAQIKSLLKIAVEGSYVRAFKEYPESKMIRYTLLKAGVWLMTIGDRMYEHKEGSIVRWPVSKLNAHFIKRAV
jgi:hypothetical protein